MNLEPLSPIPPLFDNSIVELGPKANIPFRVGAISRPVFLSCGPCGELQDVIISPVGSEKARKGRGFENRQRAAHGRLARFFGKAPAGLVVAVAGWVSGAGGEMVAWKGLEERVRMRIVSGSG